MSETVGGVKATFTGDSSGLAKSVSDVINKFDAAKQKASELNAALKDVSKTSAMSADGLNMLKQQAEAADKEVKKLSGSQGNAASAMQTLGKNMGNAKASMGAAMGAMTALSGEGGKVASIALSAGGAVNTMTEQFKSSGAGAAMAAGAIGLVATAIQLMNAYIDEQDKKAKKLETIWETLTQRSVELRQAADAAMTSAMAQAELDVQTANPTLSNHDVAVLKLKTVAMREQNAIAKEMATTAIAIAKAQNDITTATAETKDAAQAALTALQAAQASNTNAFKTQMDMAEKADLFVTAQEAASKAAVARAAAEQRAKDAMAAQLETLKEILRLQGMTGISREGAAAWQVGGMAQVGAGIAMQQNYMAGGNTPGSEWGSIDLHRSDEKLDSEAKGKLQEWITGLIGSTIIEMPKLNAPINNGAYKLFGGPGSLVPELASMTPAMKVRTADESTRLESTVASIPDAVKEAAPVFGEQAALSLITGLASGNLSTMITSMGTALGVATGVPIVGQIVGAVVGIAQQIGEIFMKAGAHIGEMIMRPVNAIMGKGGAARVSGAVGQLASDQGKAFETKMAGAFVSSFGLLGTAIGFAVNGFGQLQQELANIGFIFALTTMNETFEKFSTLVGNAFQNLLNPLGDIWIGLMPLAGAFLLMSEALAPVVTALVKMVPLKSITTLLIVGMQHFGLALVNLGIVTTKISMGFDKLGHSMGLMSNEDFSARAKASRKVMEDLENAQTAIADITIGSAEDAANREEKAAAKAEAIERAKAKARLNMAAEEDKIAASLNKFSESLTNVPSGYKRRLAEVMYQSADSESPSGGFSSPTQGMITINIGTWASRGTFQEDIANMKRLSRNGSLAAQAVSRGFNPDDRN